MTITTIKTCTKKTNTLYESLDSATTEKTSTTKAPAKAAGKRSYVEIIAKIAQSGNSEKFFKLFGNDWQGSGYKSQSHADLALCSMLAKHTNSKDTIDNIFRDSGLMRTKWNEQHASEGRTYGEMTINKALKNIATAVGEFNVKDASHLDIALEVIKLPFEQVQRDVLQFHNPLVEEIKFVNALTGQIKY